MISYFRYLWFGAEVIPKKKELLNLYINGSKNLEHAGSNWGLIVHARSSVKGAHEKQSLIWYNYK